MNVEKIIKYNLIFSDKNDNWINCNSTLDLKQKNISVISDS